MLNLKDLLQEKELTSKEMSVVVGGSIGLGTLIEGVKFAIDYGAKVGELAGQVYCATQSGNCGAASTKPKTNT